jgi:hypothetical protein
MNPQSFHLQLLLPQFLHKICLAIGPHDIRDDFRTSFQREAGEQRGRLLGPVGPVGPVDPVPVAQSDARTGWIRSTTKECGCTVRLVRFQWERHRFQGPVPVVLAQFSRRFYMKSPVQRRHGMVRFQ